MSRRRGLTCLLVLTIGALVWNFPASERSNSRSSHRRTINVAPTIARGSSGTAAPDVNELEAHKEKLPTTLQGRVVNLNGDPLPMVPLRAVAADGTQHRTGSGLVGEFSFSNLPEGTYQLDIDSSWWSTHSREVIWHDSKNVVVRGSPRTSIEVSAFDLGSSKAIPGFAVEVEAGGHALRFEAKSGIVRVSLDRHVNLVSLRVSALGYSSSSIDVPLFGGRPDIQIPRVRAELVRQGKPNLRISAKYGRGSTYPHLIRLWVKSRSSQNWVKVYEGKKPEGNHELRIPVGSWQLALETESLTYDSPDHRAIEISETASSHLEVVVARGGDILIDCPEVGHESGTAIDLTEAGAAGEQIRHIVTFDSRVSLVDVPPGRVRAVIATEGGETHHEITVHAGRTYRIP